MYGWWDVRKIPEQYNSSYDVATTEILICGEFIFKYYQYSLIKFQKLGSWSKLELLLVTPLDGPASK